jgi:preprotein translocase subunit YajC
MSPAHSSSILAMLVAGGDAGSAPPAWMQFLPLVAMGAIFWLLILRPQMRSQKEQRNKIAAIKKGDQVVTGGGLVAKVLKVDGEYAELELAPNVKVRAVKTTISDVLSLTGSKPAND